MWKHNHSWFLNRDEGSNCHYLGYHTVWPGKSSINFDAMISSQSSVHEFHTTQWLNLHQTEPQISENHPLDTPSTRVVPVRVNFWERLYHLHGLTTPPPVSRPPLAFPLNFAWKFHIYHTVHFTVSHWTLLSAVWLTDSAIKSTKIQQSRIEGYSGCCGDLTHTLTRWFMVHREDKRFYCDGSCPMFSGGTPL